MSLTKTLPAVNPLADSVSNENYSIEFFHIYTDEKIGPSHESSLHYLKEVQKAWDFDHKLVLMIDNYNPKEHILNTDEVFEYLRSRDALPDYWAFEGDLVQNAKLLLDSLTSNKLRKNYLRYIEQHGKYPCSLLTATWYLTRLGALPYENIIKTTSQENFAPSTRLINILPHDYKPVEIKAQELIKRSKFSHYADYIQDLFFPMDSGRKISLW